MVRATFRARRNCWPVGPTSDVVGGTFPGPLGRAGGSAGSLGRESVCGAVGHQGSRPALGTTPRSRGEVCRPSGRKKGTGTYLPRPEAERVEQEKVEGDSTGHSAGDTRAAGQRANSDRCNPRPLGVHPSTPSAWVQRQGGGGADLCVRSAGCLSGDPRAAGQRTNLDRPSPRPVDSRS